MTLHWKVGFDPPLLGKLVKVTGVPAQTVVMGDIVIEFPIGIGRTVMVMKFDVAGLLVPHVSWDVMVQTTVSPSTG